MRKYLGAFVFGGMVGFACTTTFGPKLAARPSPAPAPPAITLAAAEQPVEQVRHMRVRKKTCDLAEVQKEVEENQKESQASGDARPSNEAIDMTPTGSVKNTPPRKVKLARKSKKKATDQPDANAEQAPPAEAENPAPRGFFEALFQGN